VKKQITLIRNEDAVFILNRICKKKQLCYYLSEDSQKYLRLINKFGNQFEIKNLSGEFEVTLTEIKYQFLKLMDSINKKYSSNLWWSAPIASRSGSATLLIRNITYLFCANKILLERNNDLIFIVDSNALSDGIENIGKRAGYKIIKKINLINQFINKIKRLFIKVGKGPYFIFRMIQERRIAFKVFKPLPRSKKSKEKRIIIRSWFGDNTIKNPREFKDRNFGSLHTWLLSKNYDIWILPSKLKLSISVNQFYNQLKTVNHRFLIPHHYLKFSDYLNILFDAYKYMMFRINNANINGLDVSSLFNELIREFLFIPDLDYLMLKRLKERCFEIDGFYYAFESNSPEKHFILGCREFFPDSKIYGYQHSAPFHNNLTYQLVPGESAYHPLPDKIICSGSIYKELFNKAKFPNRILFNGPNLRFEDINKITNTIRSEMTYDNKNILLPLTFSYSLTFELILKVKEAFNNSAEYLVYIRTHPDLSKNKLIKFLKEIDMKQYLFADGGTIQDWFPSMKAVVSNGGSVTILEAISCGVPVIRAVPDNSIYLDPFFGSEYPINPVNKGEDIRNQLLHIEQILLKDPLTFKNIGEDVHKAYFPSLDQKKKKIFL